MTLDKIYQPVKHELEEVEERLEAIVVSEIHTIRELYDYVLSSGGKRIRPALVLLSAKSLNNSCSRVTDLACAVELIHMASLLHDDIIDWDDKRRGQDTIHYRYYKKSLENEEFGFTDEQARHFGTTVGLLAGDTQHGWSISLLSELSNDSEVDPSVTLFLIKYLDSFVLNSLLAGEMLDIDADTGGFNLQAAFSTGYLAGESAALA